MYKRVCCVDFWHKVGFGYYWHDMSNFLDFNTSLVLPIGLLTLGSPKKAQNNEFFMYAKTGSEKNSVRTEKKKKSV